MAPVFEIYLIYLEKTQKEGKRNFNIQKKFVRVPHETPLREDRMRVLESLLLSQFYYSKVD